MPALTSTRPYLIRAMHEWCSDNGFTPYISVFVDKNTLVPTEHVKDNEIILNVSYDATSGLQIGNEFVHFKSRFSGVVRDLMIPINNIQAIFAKENGQGMSFPKVTVTEDHIAQTESANKTHADTPVDTTEAAPKRSRSHLTIVK
ncbi:MAG TPA: ClpXP protease specificity-enhancing factor [Burkholderiaceae bacterium]|nr:ClpXP protease specificity-enhancing factor [Burkholderiaceae bacterium]